MSTFQKFLLRNAINLLLLALNKFFRHVEARDLFGYMEKHVTCNNYIIGELVNFSFLI